MKENFRQALYELCDELIKKVVTTNDRSTGNDTVSAVLESAVRICISLGLLDEAESYVSILPDTYRKIILYDQMNKKTRHWPYESDMKACEKVLDGAGPFQEKLGEIYGATRVSNEEILEGIDNGPFSVAEKVQLVLALAEHKGHGYLYTLAIGYVLLDDPEVNKFKTLVDIIVKSQKVQHVVFLQKEIIKHRNGLFAQEVLQDLCGEIPSITNEEFATAILSIDRIPSSGRISLLLADYYISTDQYNKALEVARDLKKVDPKGAYKVVAKIIAVNGDGELYTLICPRGEFYSVQAEQDSVYELCRARIKLGRLYEATQGATNLDPVQECEILMSAYLAGGQNDSSILDMAWNTVLPMVDELEEEVDPDTSLRAAQCLITIAVALNNADAIEKVKAALGESPCVNLVIAFLNFIESIIQEEDEEDQE